METHVCGLLIQNGAKKACHRFRTKIVRERVQFNIQQKMVRKRHDVKIVRKRNETSSFLFAHFKIVRLRNEKNSNKALLPKTTCLFQAIFLCYILI